MVGIVVDLDVDRTVDPWVDLVFDLVAGGDVAEEVEGLDVSHAVFEVVTTVLVPVALQVAGGDGDLGLSFRVVVCGADDSVVSDPVGVRVDEVGAASERVTAMREVGDRAKMLVAAAARVGQLRLGVVANIWKVAGIEEG